MNPSPGTPLAPALRAALQHVRRAAREAVRRTLDGLGVSALAAAKVFQRDNLLAAQFELNRKTQVFLQAFDEALVATDRGGYRLAAAEGARAPG